MAKHKNKSYMVPKKDVTPEEALEIMKSIERKLSGKLVSRKIDSNTIITTTKDRIDKLVSMHACPVKTR